MPTITVAGIEIDVVRKDIKNLHLGVYPPTGRVRIATPLRVADEAVRLFAISKLSWIRKQQARFRTQERQSPREYISGESHYYKGRRYLLNVIYHDAPPRVSIRNKKYLDLYVRHGSDKLQREKVLTEWYRQKLKDLIPGLLIKWQPIVGTEVKEWGVKQMKTRWGTCNREAGRIWLNLELIKKPQSCIEYILVHEMLHFFERHHNERFLSLLDSHLPNWRTTKAELNRLLLEYKDWKY